MIRRLLRHLAGRRRTMQEDRDELAAQPCNADLRGAMPMAQCWTHAAESWIVCAEAGFQSYGGDDGAARYNYMLRCLELKSIRMTAPIRHRRAMCFHVGLYLHDQRSCLPQIDQVHSRSSPHSLFILICMTGRTEKKP